MKKLLMFSALFAAGFLVPLPAAQPETVLKIIADACNLREGAGKNWKSLSVLKYGDRVTYLENTELSEELSGSEAPWIKVRAADGTTGFVFGSLLSFVSSPDGMAPYVEYSATPLAFTDRAKLEKTEPERRYRYKRHWFSPKEFELLSSKGFSIEKGSVSQYVNVDDMVDRYLPYADIRKTEPVIQTTDIDIPTYKLLPLYITSDYMLHCWHLIFDRMLENIETEKLYPALKKLSMLEYESLRKAYEKEKDSRLRDARFSALCFAAVPCAVLSQSFDDEGNLTDRGLGFIKDADVAKAVDAELGYISAGSGPGTNAVTGGKIDYSHFKVRGHYTHSAHLGSYFRAMIWYGTVTFPLKDRPVEGALIADTFRSADIMAAWNALNGVIERLVGRSDDLGPREYLRAADSVFGKAIDSWPPADKLARYADEVAKLSKSAIVSSPLRNAAGGFDEAKSLDGFRFMGQRFILDSRVFTLLTSPRVGDDAHPRNIPKGLDLFAAYGSAYAESLLKDDIGSIPNFRKNYEKAKAELRARDMKDPTVYEAWVDLLAYYASSKDKVRQRFTAAPEWTVRKLNAAHGSWAELRHDTILYAKPSAAECGGPDGEPVWVAGTPSIPRGYAEPDPSFFEKLKSLTVLLRDSCAKERLLSDAYKLKTGAFADICDGLIAVTKKEVEGKAFTDEDAIFLGSINRTLADIVIPAGRWADSMTSDEKQMALVADIHTDYLSGAILHTAVGAPRRITIFVSDASGARVCEGCTFSYYEFTAGTRMTDEEWKREVYGAGAPESLSGKEPSWTRALPYSD